VDVIERIISRGRLLSRNAESDIYLSRYLGEPVIVKKRVPKPYRNPSLDSRLRLLRTYREANILYQSRGEGIPVPELYLVSLKSTALVYKYIEGKTLASHLLEYSLEVGSQYLVEMGSIIGMLHSTNVVHGDPHPANFIISDGKLYIIDFGLAFISSSTKEQVYDLDVVYRSLYSLIPKYAEEYFRRFLEGYRGAYYNSDEAIKLHSRVARMGRYHERSG